MTTALALPDDKQLVQAIQEINRFQQLVHANLVKDQDYGVIPGTQKPTLLKPGAEKIAKLLQLADTYEIMDKSEDWDKPFFRYMIRATLTYIPTGTVISQGMGECNSYEGKYRWREAKRKCPACGSEAIIKGKAEYGGGWLCFKKQGGCGAKFEDGDDTIEGQAVGKIENEDIYSQVNTILKMAKKRALVDATLSAGRLSQIFTQDMEDIESPAEAKKAPVKAVEGKATAPATEAPPVSKDAAPVAKKKGKVYPENWQPQTLGDILQWAYEVKGLDRSMVFEILHVKALNEVADLAEAFDKVKQAKSFEVEK